MAPKYNLCARLKNGDIEVIASSNDLEEARQLALTLNRPGGCVIRDSVSGKDVDREEADQWAN